ATLPFASSSIAPRIQTFPLPLQVARLHSLTGASEAIMRCELCRALPRDARTTRRHERLRQVGLTQRIARPGHGKAAWVTFHVCEVCATQWRHVDDPGNQHAGWSVEHGGIPRML